jgi:hypothetical protein
MPNPDPASPNFNPLNKNHLEKMINYCAEMDAKGFTHCDLQVKNFLTTQDGKLGIIDFETDRLKNNPSDILLGRNKHVYDRWHLYFEGVSDNPFYHAPSNASNFEYRALQGYMEKMPDGQQKPFFTDYLKIRGAEYHTKQAEFLKGLKDNKQNEIFENIQNKIRGKSKAEPDTIKKYVKNMLNKAIRHEEISAEALKNPSDNVIKAEFLKMQLRYFIKNDDGYSPEQIAKFHQQATKVVSKMCKNTSGNDAEYLKSCLTFFKSFRGHIIPHNSGNKTIDLENLLINKVFGKDTIKFDDTDASKTLAKSTKNAKLKPIGIGLGIVGVVSGLGYCIYKAVNRKTTEIQNENKNNYSGYRNRAFAEFFKNL